MNSALKKACDIVIYTLFEAPNSNEKADILRNVEEKWNIFSPTVEINKGFMNLVIHAIKSMFLRDDYRLCTNISETAKDALLKMFKITEPSPTSASEPKADLSDEKKKTLLKEMVHKIHALVSKALQKSKSDNDKRKIIDFIKIRIAKAFELNGKSKKLINGTSLYTGIISQGIDMIVNQSVQHPVKTKYGGAEEAALTNANRRNEAALGGIENLVYYKPQPKLMPSLLSKATPTLENDIHNSVGKEIVDNNLGEIVTSGPFIGLTKDYDCREVASKMCKKLRAVSEFTCELDGEILEIEQFCDGTIDCADGSDERNCAKHGTD